jgi:hypothetical protein
MKNTNCEKCIFSDYFDSSEPCAVGIIEQIRDSKSLLTNDQKFYSIANYLCPYAFSMEVYEKNKEQIGSIDDLKRQLRLKSQPAYYMVVFLDETELSVVAQKILDLPVKPGFVSLITYQNNNTENVIHSFSILNDKVQWKLHNLLEDFEYQDSLSVVFDTNPAKNTCQFLWVTSGSHHSLWHKDILNITDIVTIKQPVAHALYRKPEDKDGLFVSFKVYEEIRHNVNMDISLALEEIENPLIKYYA